jgi:hypothetical protein
MKVMNFLDGHRLAVLLVSPKMRHCEERRDEAISMIRRKWREMASLRSQ